MITDRPCVGCDVVDGGPRDVVAERKPGLPPHPEPWLRAGLWHFTCHAEAGCPTCAAATAPRED